MFYRLINKIKLLPRNTKFRIQKIFRGYGDDDLWSLDYWMLKKIRKPFKAFVKNQKEHGHSYPAHLSVKNKEIDIVKKIEDPGAIKWIKILEQIEEAIDLMWLDYSCNDKWYDMTSEEHRIANDKINKGWKLFGEYFGSFWD
uniref:Uncharacterized protein n=1 Tax=viral metagenome TaxID=1070528 RepID=A0A6M3JKE0_9ZZZZ